LVERLFDRYVQIFKAVQANRVAEVSTSLKVRGTGGYGSHILYGTAIGFDASFAFARSVVPRGWTLVHFAAQAATRDMVAALVDDCGLSCTERDEEGRTPLHVAAAALNVPVVVWLLDHRHGPRMAAVPDRARRLPLQLLLRTLAVSDWTAKVTAADVLALITKLLPAPHAWWRRDPPAEDAIVGGSGDENNNDSSSSGALLDRSALYAVLHSVRRHDDVVARHAVAAAQRCPRDQWDVPGVVLPCVLLALQHRRPALLALLFDAFGEAVVGHLHEQDGRRDERLRHTNLGVAAFLHGCLALAVQGGASLHTLEFLYQRGAVYTNVDTAALAALAQHEHGHDSGGEVEEAGGVVAGAGLRPECLCPYLHVAVLRCNNALPGADV
jgi:hypothetical protein